MISSVSRPALVNENNAAYRFSYDTSDRLSEEVRVDNLTRRLSYDVGGHLTRLDEIGYGEKGERPERHTLFERDAEIAGTVQRQVVALASTMKP